MPADHAQAKQLTDRHPNVQSLMRWLKPNENLPPAQRQIALHFYDLSLLLLAHLDDGPELVAGLRKLVEGKDCMVRQSLDDEAARG